MAGATGDSAEPISCRTTPPITSIATGCCSITCLHRARRNRNPRTPSSATTTGGPTRIRRSPPARRNPMNCSTITCTSSRRSRRRFSVDRAWARYKRGFSYTAKAETTWQLLREQTGSAAQGAWTADRPDQQHGRARAHQPKRTLSRSAWYLLSINPFFDYTFTLPGKQAVLMLDWARTESVLFDDISRGVARAYDPLDPGSAAGTPRASSAVDPSPASVGHRVRRRTEPGESRGGTRATDWSCTPTGIFRTSSLAGRPTRTREPREVRMKGIPCLPSGRKGAPYGMTPERGTLQSGAEFITLMANPRSSVRMVLSGHIHRNGLYVVHPATNRIYVATPKDIVKQQPIVGALLVRGVVPQAVSGARPPAVTGVPDHRPGPLYVTTTSAGPRGSFEDMPLTGSQTRTGVTTDPGYTALELASDGTIKRVEFRAPRKLAAQPARPAVHAEMAFEAW